MSRTRLEFAAEEDLKAIYPRVRQSWFDALRASEPNVPHDLAAQSEVEELAAWPRHGDWLSYALRYLRTHPAAMLGLLIMVVSLALAVVGPMIGPFDPEQSNPADSLQPPSWTHLFGTDATGMDVYSRVLASPRIDITIGIVAAAIACLVGTLLGLVSGYFGGRLAEVIGRTADLIQSLPVFVVAMALVAASPGSKMANIIFVVAFINSPVYLRLTRTQVLTVKERGFVEAARSLGNHTSSILFRHVLPNSLGPVFVQLSVNVGWAILLTAGLSFVGAGIQVPTPEWGEMIATGAGNVITGQWWVSVFPGLALGATVFGFAVTGETLAYILDPRNR